MAIDIKNMLDEVLAYFKKSAGAQWEMVEEQGLEFIETRKQRLLHLALETTTGNLSPEFLIEKAKEELIILENEAIALGIISATMTQEVVNTTIQNLLALVIKALTDKINEDKA